MADKGERKPPPNAESRVFSRRNWIARFDLGLLSVLATFVLFALALVAGDAFRPDLLKVTGIDPVCYYAWLRSPAFDRDFDFTNEYRALNPPDRFGPGELADPDGPRTRTGHLGNVFSVGPAILWAPFVLGGHVVAGRIGAAQDGFSQPYHSAVFVANAAYGLLGLILMYYALRTWFDRTMSAIAAIAAWACSPAVYYTFSVFAMSHACSFFSITLFLLAWARLRSRDALWAWAIIGATVGLATLVRWQNLTFALVPAMDALVRGPRRYFPRLALAGAVGATVFFPQMLGWKIVYGSYLTIPQGGEFMHWTRPWIIQTLFSPAFGLLSWTPLCAAGIVGLFLWRGERRQVLVILALAFLVQFYVAASAPEPGWSFGMRRLVNCTPLFAVGMAEIGARLQTSRLFWTIPVAAMFALWNFLFILQYAGFMNVDYIKDGLRAHIQQHGVASLEHFDFDAFVAAHEFPRQRGPSFQQFVLDKPRVLRKYVARVVDVYVRRQAPPNDQTVEIDLSDLMENEQ